MDQNNFLSILDNTNDIDTDIEVVDKNIEVVDKNIEVVDKNVINNKEHSKKVKSPLVYPLKEEMSILNTIHPSSPRILSLPSPQLQSSSPSIFFTSQHLIFQSLVHEKEIKELSNLTKENPYLTELFENGDELLNALNVISMIKPTQRISTQYGIQIQKDPPVQNTTWNDFLKNMLKPIWFVRFAHGENRLYNLKTLRGVFIGAFLMIETALYDREKMNEHQQHDHIQKLTRKTVISKLNNEQLIQRMLGAITSAIEGIQNLKETYKEDTNTCARIETLVQIIKDKMILVNKSLEFL